MQDKRINIKIVTKGNFPFGRASANYLRNLAIGLSDYNNVEVLLPYGYNYGAVKNKNASRLGRIENLTWRYLSFINAPKNKFIRAIGGYWGGIHLLFYLILARLKNNIDIIIKYNIDFSYNLLLLAVCKVTKIKLINIIPEFYNKPAQVSIALIKWYNFYIGLTYLARFSDGMIVLSKYLEKYVRLHGFSKSLIIIPNIINPETFNAKVSSFKKGAITIGYAGTPTKKDGIDDLLKSFAIVHKEFPDTHLLIVGDVASKTVIPTLKEKAENLGIFDVTTFTGLVDFTNIPGLLNSCDILMLSRPKGIASEAGFPTKLGEYMACKKPVVVTRVGDIVEYFENNNSVILVEPNNIESIAQGIKSIINDSALQIKIGNEGYQWMLKHLEYKRVAKEISSWSF